MLKSVIKNRIMTHCLFSTSQHGFRPEHSCVTQLLNVMEEIMESGLCKAFDRVPHNRLLSKLKCYGLGGQLVDWILYVTF